MLPSFSKMYSLMFFPLVLHPKNYASGHTVSYMMNVLPASSLVEPSCYEMMEMIENSLQIREGILYCSNPFPKNIHHMVTHLFASAPKSFAISHMPPFWFYESSHSLLYVLSLPFPPAIKWLHWLLLDSHWFITVLSNLLSLKLREIFFIDSWLIHLFVKARYTGNNSIEIPSLLNCCAIILAC